MFIAPSEAATLFPNIKKQAGMVSRSEVITDSQQENNIASRTSWN